MSPAFAGPITSLLLPVRYRAVFVQEEFEWAIVDPGHRARLYAKEREPSIGKNSIVSSVVSSQLMSSPTIVAGLLVISALRPRDAARRNHRGRSTVHTTQRMFSFLALSMTRLEISL